MATLSIGDPRPPVLYKLVYWIAGSLMLHLLLLLYLERPDTLFTLQTGRATLHVTIEAHTSAVSASLVQQPPANREPILQKPLLPTKKRASKKSTATTEGEALAQVAQIASPSPPSIEMEKPTNNEPEATTNIRTLTQQRDEIESRLKQELARHFNYPRLARRRGWQGEVTISFTLETDGRIRDVRIAHSSGNSVLDKAALLSVGKVARIKQTPPQPLTFKLPIIYKLT